MRTQLATSASRTAGVSRNLAYDWRLNFETLRRGSDRAPSKTHLRDRAEQALGFAARRGFGLFVAQGGPDAGPFGSHIPFKIDTSKPVPIAHFHVTAGNGLAACPSFVLNI
jgi:hypothetical protein